MKLYFFKRSESHQGSGHRYSNRLSINVNRTCIILSGLLAETMNITQGSNIALCFNKEHPSDLFIGKVNPNDDKQTPTATVRGSKGSNSLRFSHKGAISMIMDITHATQSVTLTVCKTPERINNQNYYRIITENPLRIK